jgi:hypothetical protein
MQMRLTSLLGATALVVGFAFAGNPAQAANTFATCPATSFTNSATTPPNCNLVITFNADGSISTTIPTGATANYDNSEDSLIGVFNNTASTLSSFNISGSSIFSLMDNDGINTLTGATNAAAGMSSANVAGLGADAYGGEDAYFTNVIFGSPDSGTVNFLHGIAPGGSDYFSLEEPISVSALPTITAAPEPSTLAVLAVGLLGAGLVRRRKA